MSAPAAKPASRRAKPLLLLAALGLVVLGLVAYCDGPQAEPPSAAVTAMPAPVAVDLGALLDWNLAKSGQLADHVRSLVTDRIFELGPDGRYVHRLGAALAVDGPVAKVTLKDGIFWSDEVPLVAEHVVDAWTRFQERATADASLAESKTVQRWVSSVRVRTLGKLQLEIVGYDTVEDLSRFVRSRYLAPIRRDLLEQGPQAAWLVGVGRYRLAAMPAVPSGAAALEFVPNPRYYGEVANEPIRLEISSQGEQTPAPSAGTR